MNKAYQKFPVGTRLEQFSETYGYFNGVVVEWPFHRPPEENEIAIRFDHMEPNQAVNHYVEL